MIPAARNSAKHAVLVAALLSSSAAFISPPALADQSMEELEARLEKAKKRNLMLKAELLERDDITGLGPTGIDRRFDPVFGRIPFTGIIYMGLAYRYGEN
jgi:hypothetical protein